MTLSYWYLEQIDIMKGQEGIDRDAESWRCEIRRWGTNQILVGQIENNYGTFW